MASTIKSKVKFSNVDILSFMAQVVEKHTKHYQSDFEIDKEILTEAADRQKQRDKTFIWLCRTSGTWLLLERNVFLKGTSENNTFTFYAEQTSDPILAYVIEITSGAQDSITGNVYVLDYMAHYDHVCTVSLKAETVVIQYERGCRVRKADERIDGHPDAEYGNLVSVHQPHSEDELKALLQKERQEGVCYREGCANTYISRLL